MQISVSSTLTVFHDGQFRRDRCRSPQDAEEPQAPSAKEEAKEQRTSEGVIF